MKKKEMECRNHEEKKEAKEVVWKESKQASKQERKKERQWS